MTKITATFRAVLLYCLIAMRRRQFDREVVGTNLRTWTSHWESADWEFVNCADICRYENRIDSERMLPYLNSYTEIIILNCSGSFFLIFLQSKW